MSKLYTTLLTGSMLAAVACVGNAATFSYNFLETDSIPTAFTYAHTTGTTYTLTGSTTETSVIFSGSYTGAATPGTPYAATLTITAVESEGDLPNPHAQELLDSVTATWKFTSGNIAGDTFTVTAGLAAPGNAGVLSALSGTSSGGFSGSNTSGTLPNNVAFSSTGGAITDTSAFSDQSYSFTLALPTGTAFAYTPRPFPSSVSDLNGFVASLTGGGVATSPVPEPGSVALAIGGLVSFSALRLRRRR
jgi:hypothetical protein